MTIGQGWLRLRLRCRLFGFHLGFKSPANSLPQLQSMCPSIFSQRAQLQASKWQTHRHTADTRFARISFHIIPLSSILIEATVCKTSGRYWWPNKQELSKNVLARKAQRSVSKSIYQNASKPWSGEFCAKASKSLQRIRSTIRTESCPKVKSSKENRVL